MPVLPFVIPVLKTSEVASKFLNLVPFRTPHPPVVMPPADSPRRKIYFVVHDFVTILWVPRRYLCLNARTDPLLFALCSDPLLFALTLCLTLCSLLIA